MTTFKSPFPDLPLRDLTITQALFAALERSPDRIVLTDGPTGQDWTAADLMAAIKRFAGALSAKGFGAGHRFAMMAPNCPEFAVVFHGVAWAGGTITTINPSYTAPEISHQLKDSGAEVLFTPPAFEAVAREGLKGTDCRHLVMLGDWQA
jgi:acyl-CoA synthetase (AMP-forming)/AMP-acid ligase II